MPRPARHAAVEPVEQHRDEDGAAGDREVAVDGRDDGIEAGEQAAGGEQIGQQINAAARRIRGVSAANSVASEVLRHGRHHRRIPHLIHSRAPMRWSQYPVNTTKETPADAEVVSHQLMLRAGLIRKLAAGLYTWMPLGLRAMRKVENIVREEMNRAGALEVIDAGRHPRRVVGGIRQVGRVRPGTAAPQGSPRARFLPRARRTRKSSPTSRATSSRAIASCRRISTRSR